VGTPLSKNLIPKFIFALLLGASLSPVLLVPIPAMVDYINHLARMFILSRSGNPDANPFYQVAWAMYPNLAMDLLIPQLAHLVGVENATRFFLLISQVLLITGAMAIERVVKGRLQISGFAALMFLYCLPFAWGFLNFEFGLGIALWGIAASLKVQERPWPFRLGVNAAFAAALFAAHFFALGVYGTTVGLQELWRARDRKAAYLETALRLVVLAVPALALLGAMMFTVGSIGGVGTSWFFEFKPLWLFHIMNGYSLTVSAASVVALIGLLYVAARRGVLKLEPAGLWMAIGFAVLYLAIPSQLFGTSFVDFRIIAAAAFILPAFCSLALPSHHWKLVTMSCVTSITLANLGVVLFVWISYRADYAAMIESFRKIDKGSLVLVGHSGDVDDPPLGNLLEYPIYHAPTLAVHYADAFVPSLFAAVGKQPVTARPAYRRLEVSYGGIVPVAVLKAIAENALPNAPAFIRSWQHDFDYLYVIGPRVQNPMPRNLEELYAASRFVLYKVRK
jgi:hypothetical protein